MPPKGGRGLSRSLDDYAAHRCQCGHLLYANQQPGSKCLFCSCADHRPRVTESEAGQPQADGAA